MARAYKFVEAAVAIARDSNLRRNVNAPSDLSQPQSIQLGARLPDAQRSTGEA